MCDWLDSLPEKEISFLQERIKRVQRSGAPLLVAQGSLQPQDAATELRSPRKCPLVLVEGSIVRTPEASGCKDQVVGSNVPDVSRFLGSPAQRPLILVEGSIIRTPENSGRKNLSLCGNVSHHLGSPASSPRRSLSRATETFEAFESFLVLVRQPTDVK